MKKVIHYLPFILGCLFYGLLMTMGESIVLSLAVPFLLFLFFIPFCLLNKNKIIGIILMIIFMIICIIVGYHDALKWVTTIVGAIITIYYVIIYRNEMTKWKK